MISREVLIFLVGIRVIKLYAQDSKNHKIIGVGVVFP